MAKVTGTVEGIAIPKHGDWSVQYSDPEPIRVLFIGGPADGTRRILKQYEREIVLLQHEKMYIPNQEEVLVEDSVVLKKHVYRVQGVLPILGALMGVGYIAAYAESDPKWINAMIVHYAKQGLTTCLRENYPDQS